MLVINRSRSPASCYTGLRKVILKFLVTFSFILQLNFGSHSVLHVVVDNLRVIKSKAIIYAGHLTLIRDEKHT